MKFQQNSDVPLLFLELKGMAMGIHYSLFRFHPRETCLFDRFVVFGEQRIFGTIRQVEFSNCHLHLLATVKNISRYSGTQVDACLFDRFVLFGE